MKSSASFVPPPRFTPILVRCQVYAHSSGPLPYPSFTPGEGPKMLSCTMRKICNSMHDVVCLTACGKTGFDGANRDVDRRRDFFVFRSDLSDCTGARFRRIRCDDQLIFCLVT